jgi:tetraacyldisaccharide 4'-kinase
VRRILFVANGHGETAIAGRIAHEIARLSGDAAGLDLFPLVGTGGGANGLHVVGPRRAMPSGGLVAMGNVRAFSRDVGAGFAGLFARQVAFVREARAYDATVAVGDAYALAFAFGTRLPTFFVGTAKSVYVAAYGPFERLLLRSAVRIFVRDEATAVRLRSQGVRAEAPGNVIADLASTGVAAPPGRWIGVLPGSREDAYDDGLRLARVIRALGKGRAGTAALLSVAPTLDASRFARALGDDGWIPAPAEAASPFAFDVRDGETRLAGWTGDLGPLLGASIVTLGQAGTANEQAAAFGVPVVALDRTAGGGRGGADWYRMRQRRLLGDALLLVPAQPQEAAASLGALLDDSERLLAMSAAGRARMGAPGGAEAIARAVLSAVA